MTAAGPGYHLLVARLRERGLVVSECGGRVKAHCPAHNDRKASLGVIVGDEGGPIPTCFAGCSREDVLAALGLTWKEVLSNGSSHKRVTKARTKTERTKPARYKTIVEAINATAQRIRGRPYKPDYYRDDFAEVRFDLSDSKTFRPFSWTKDGWAECDPDGLLPLFPDPMLADARIVQVHEGPKCCRIARALGFVTTTSAHGSFSPHKTNWSPVAGKTIPFFPDADDSGERFLDQVGAIVTSLDPPATVRVVRLPDLPEGGDIEQFVDDRRTEGKDDAAIRAEILAYIEQAEQWRPSEDPQPSATVAAGGQILRHDRTELGNAHRFVRQHGLDVRWVEPWKKWLVYDGRHWAVDDTRAVHRLAEETVKSIYREAADQSDSDERKRLSTWASSSERRNAITNMLELAKHQLPTAPDQLDRDPLLLNVENGTIDLRTGQLRPHRREDMITKLAPVAFDPDANCPTFLEFLDRIFASNCRVIDFVQRFFGYGLTGLVSAQVLVFLFGTGANGKSTLVEFLMRLMGDYAGLAAPDLLVQRGRSDSRHPCELADLFSIRLAVASETDEGRWLRTSMMKSLTGDRRVKARRMNENFWEFDATHKLVLVTNNKPVIRERTDAIWRRILLVPFNVRIPDPEQDEHLPDKLDAERSGALNWLLVGCDQWQKRGLEPPPEVSQATAEYKAESDIVGRFVDECCELDRDAVSSATKLLDAFNAWSGLKWSHRRFGPELDRLGLFTRVREPGTGRKARRGIRLVGEWASRGAEAQECEPS